MAVPGPESSNRHEAAWSRRRHRLPVGVRRGRPSTNHTDTASGRDPHGVVRANGIGVPSVAVTLLDGPNATRSTTTTAAGRYELGNLTPGGTVSVQASAAEHISDARTVTLADCSTLDFDLRPIPRASLRLDGVLKQVSCTSTTCALEGFS
jgi:hypothetical protein